MGGSGYDFNISFFNESEAIVYDDPCISDYGHHLICVNELLESTIYEMDYESQIFNGIIVTDKWILTSATACLNIYNSPWNDYVISAGTHNLTNSDDGSIIKDYHIYSKENENQERGCNQYDDYCLIELEDALVISENVQAIGFQHFTTTGSTTTTTGGTTTWDSTWHPGLTTTITTSTTTTMPTTTTSTTTTISTKNDRRKRRVVPVPTGPLPPSIFTTTTTTKSAETNPTPSPEESFDKCWIAAWSDNNLRTFKVDINNQGYCDSYYPSEHRPFRKHKLSTEEQAKLKEKMQANKKVNITISEDINEFPDFPNSEEIIAAVVEAVDDAIMNHQGVNYYGQRSHICIDNLRHVCIDTNSYCCRGKGAVGF